MKQKQHFIKRFSEIVFHLLYSSMADDHRILFSFYLSMMYSRGTNNFSEKEWKILLNWSVPQLEQNENEDEHFLNLFESDNKPIKNRKESTQMLNMKQLQVQIKQEKDVWNKQNNKLISFFKLPNNIIAPLICFAQGKQLQNQLHLFQYLILITEKQSLLEKFQERKELLKESGETSPGGGAGGFAHFAKKLGLKEKILKFQQEEEQSPKEKNMNSARSDLSNQSNFSLISPYNLSNRDQFKQSSNESSPANKYNPLLRKFNDRSEQNSQLQDGDEIIEGDNQRTSPLKTSKLNSSLLASKLGLKNMSSQFSESSKNALDINYQNFKPQTVMNQFSKRFIHLMGREVLERFVESFTHFQVKGSIKIAINSLIENPEQWIQFVQNSLVDFEMKDEYKKELEEEIKKSYESRGIKEEDDEDDDDDEEEAERKKMNKLYESQKVDAVKYIPYLPREVIKSSSYLQLLFIFKHFRPDFLPQAAEYVSQKMLRGFIDYELAPMSLESHCEQDWQRRPTILLHDQVQNRVFEILELLQSVANPEGNLLRISLGYTSIRNIVDQINQAAGAGRWILLEEIEKMEINDLKYLLRTLDQELEASTTTKTFRVWISHNASLNKENNLHQFKPFQFSKNGQILQSFYQTCWKIFYTSPKNVQQAMQRFYYRNIHDYRYNFEQPKTSQNQKNKDKKDIDFYSTKIEKEIAIKKNLIYSNVVQMQRKYNIRQGLLPYPIIDAVDDNFFQNQTTQSVSATISGLNPKVMNLFSFVDFANPSALANIAGNNPPQEKDDYKSQFTKFQNKFKFSLAFLHCCLGRKREQTNNVWKSYDSQLHQHPNEQFETDLDFQQEITTVFNILMHYSTNPRQFLNQYFKMIYGFHNPYYVNMILHFVFSNMEGSLKLSVKNYSYLLYDFNSGVFDYVEEGVAKILSQNFPSTIDPLELFFSSFNNQLIQDYTKAKQFMHKINLIEDEWQNNSLVKSLRYLEKLQKITQVNAKQIDMFQFEKLSPFSPVGKKGKKAQLYLNTEMISPIPNFGHSESQKQQVIKGLQNLANNNENVAVSQSYIHGTSNEVVSLNVLKKQSDTIVEDNQMQESQNITPKPSIVDMLKPSQSQVNQSDHLSPRDLNIDFKVKKQPSIMISSGNLAQKIEFSKELFSPLSPQIPLMKTESNDVDRKQIKQLSMNLSHQQSHVSHVSHTSHVSKIKTEEDQIIEKIQHQMKSFFKVYYRNLLSQHEKFKDLKSILENLLKNINFEFHLKEIGFLKYQENVKISQKSPEELPEYILQWISQQQLQETESSAELVQLKAKQKTNISFNSLPRSSILRPSDYASPKLSIASPQRNSILQNLSPQTNQSSHRKSRMIQQMNLGQNTGLIGQGAQKSTFSEKMKQQRRESTTAHLMFEIDKKDQMQAESQKIASSRRESRFADQLLNFQKQDEEKKKKKKLKSKKSEQSSNDDSSGSSQSDEKKSNSSSSSESDDDVDIIEDIQRNTFKSTLLNEAIILFRLIQQMKNDIRNVIDFISNQFDLQSIGQRNYLRQIISDIEQNIVPETWRKLSFKVSQRNLCDYLQMFFQKIQYTRTIISRGISLQLPNVIQIDRLVDCHTFFGSYLYNYSEANNVDILQLKFVIKKPTYAELQKKSGAEKGFFIKGLFINNGLIHKDTSYLVEEEIRQFQFDLPIYHIEIVRKLKLRQEIYSEISSNYEQSIAIELNDQNVQMLRYDMENEYLFQQLHPINLYNYDGTQILAENKKIEEDSIAHLATVINSVGGATGKVVTSSPKKPANSKSKKLQSQKTQNVDKQKDDYQSYKQASLNLSKLGPKELKFVDLYTQSKYTFVVRIPFKNPCTSSSYSHMQNKYYLYINSRKPQDYWQLKGTTLVAYKQTF